MSYPERKVAEFLKKMNIKWTYEQSVFVWDDEGRPRVSFAMLVHFTVILSSLVHWPGAIARQVSQQWFFRLEQIVLLGQG